MPSGRTGSEGRDSDLGEPPQLRAEVASFLQGSSEMPEEENKEMSPEPPISQPAEWVQWKAERCDVPNWWAELSTVLLEDIERLAQQVRASFKLLRHMHELDPEEAPFHASPAPPCLHQWRFMPPVVSAFACWDIWEIPREKNGSICLGFAVPCRVKQPAKEGPTMPIGGEHGQTKERGRILPFLYKWGGFLGSRPPQRGREQTLRSYRHCCWYPWHHCHCRDSAHMKGGSKLCQVGHSITPVLTCNSHRGSPPANCCTTSEEKSPSTHQDHSH